MDPKEHEKQKAEVKAVRAFKGLFLKNNKLTLDGSRVLDDLAVFCNVNSYNHGNDPTEIMRDLFRLEVYNWIQSRIQVDRRMLSAQRKQVLEYEEQERQRKLEENDNV